MPALAPLALRYLLWLVVLRVLYTLLVQFTGLPNLPATGVILAALPATDIGRTVARAATRPLGPRDWGLVWALMMSIYLALNVILPAIVLAPFRAALADPAALVNVVTIIVATGLLLALFQWIGARAGRGAR